MMMSKEPENNKQYSTAMIPKTTSSPVALLYGRASAKVILICEEAGRNSIVSGSGCSGTKKAGKKVELVAWAKRRHMDGHWARQDGA
jgi:hypothetical protein